MNTKLNDQTSMLTVVKMPRISKNSMAQAILIGAIATAPMSAMAKSEPVVIAGNSEHAEVLGFGVGTIIGGVLGGPAGAFITGLAASLMAKTAKQKDHQQLLLAQLNAKDDAQQAQYAEFKQQVNMLEQNYQAELLSQEQKLSKVGQLQLANLMMSLQFSTGSSDIAAPYHEQLSALAKILTQTPKVHIELSGYTDKQGDEQLNQALSMARVSTVKAALVAKGIEATRISTYGYGDKATLVATNEHKASFFDRRVVIKLQQSDDITAKN